MNEILLEEGGGVPGAHLHPPLVRSGAPRKIILTNGFKKMKNFSYEQPGDGEHHSTNLVFQMISTKFPKLGLFYNFAMMTICK